jgi:hypothetical protein
MIINSYIDVSDASASPANTWFFINSVDGGNNQNITFTTYSGVTVVNVDVQDCNASPAFWFAENNSIDSGNNVNWIFNSVITPSNSQFMMFF